MIPVASLDVVAAGSGRAFDGTKYDHEKLDTYGGPI